MANEYLLDVGESFLRFNEVENPSFEIDTTGWALTGLSGGRSTADAYAGTACLQATSVGTSTTARAEYANLFVTAGSDYRFSCWVKNTSGATRDMQLRVDWDAGTDVSGTAVSVTSGGAWTYLSMSGTVPAGASTVTLIVYTQVTNAAINNQTRIDAVMFEQPTQAGGTIATETFYFDNETQVGVPATVFNARSRYITVGSNRSQCQYETYDTNVVAVQTLSVFLGRRNDTDSTAASTANLACWYPNGFATPITKLVPGNPCRIRRVGKTAPLWQGRVRDVRVDWSQPWTGTVGNGDIVNIEAEGYLGEFGRARSTGLPDEYVSVLFSREFFGLWVDWLAPVGYDPIIADSETNGIVSNYAEWLNYIAATFVGTIQDGNPTVQLKTGNYYEDADATFSDVSNSANIKIYETIEYDSLADNLLREIRVEAPVAFGVADGDPRGRDTQIQTLSFTDDEAQGLANDLVVRYGTPTYQVSMVACRAEAQHTMNLDGLGTDPWNELIGKRTTVTFRGATSDVRIQGLEVTADPSTALYTFYFSAENPVEYFILDSSDYGVLDTNRLGW